MRTLGVLVVAWSDVDVVRKYFEWTNIDECSVFLFLFYVVPLLFLRSNLELAVVTRTSSNSWLV